MLILLLLFIPPLFSSTQNWSDWTLEEMAENLETTPRIIRALSIAVSQNRHSTHWHPIRKHLQCFLSKGEEELKECAAAFEAALEATKEHDCRDTSPITHHTSQAELFKNGKIAQHLRKPLKKHADGAKKHRRTFKDSLCIPRLSWDTNNLNMPVELRVPLFLLEKSDFDKIPNSKAVCEGAAPLWFPKEWTPASLGLAKERLYTGDKIVYVTIPLLPPSIINIPLSLIYSGADLPLSFVCIDLDPNGTTPHPERYKGVRQQLLETLEQIEETPAETPREFNDEGTEV